MVSIHALLAECDFFRYTSNASSHGFNPRTPCGVRLDSGLKITGDREFQSTHSLRSATCLYIYSKADAEFQSTHSLRSATDMTKALPTEQLVSIHALLAECDQGRSAFLHAGFRFNPRTPCGVRLRPTLYIATQQSKSYFAPTSLKRPSLHGCSF